MYEHRFCDATNSRIILITECTCVLVRDPTKITQILSQVKKDPLIHAGKPKYSKYLNAYYLWRIKNIRSLSTIKWLF